MIFVPSQSSSPSKLVSTEALASHPDDRPTATKSSVRQTLPSVSESRWYVPATSWGFSSGTNPSKQNFCRATLIVYLVAFVCFFLFGGLAFFSAMHGAAVPTGT